MSRGLRNWAAAFTVLAILATSAPALATDTYDERSNASAMVDVLILRPMGLLAFASGAVIFAAISPVMLIARPQELGKPFEALVSAPARYVWQDPIGSH
jgi:hypothetical protein